METVIRGASVVAVNEQTMKLKKKVTFITKCQGQMIQNLTLVTSCERFSVLIE